MDEIVQNWSHIQYIHAIYHTAKCISKYANIFLIEHSKNITLNNTMQIEQIIYERTSECINLCQKKTLKKKKNVNDQ